MTIKTLLENRGDEHHIFPKKYLENNQFIQKEYNQVANYVFTEQSTNIKIKDLAPEVYFEKIKNQIAENNIALGTLDSINDLENNLTENDIPLTVMQQDYTSYKTFLQQRRQLISQRIKHYYQNL